jgi:osmotically-inducible protein OsmY
MKTDTASTKATDRPNESERDAKERWDGEGGTPGRLPRKRSRKLLHAWIVAASLIALGAVPQARAQSPNQSPNASFGDAVITALVTNALDHDRALTGADISILTVGRVVYLRGYADTINQIERAGTLARRVEGVNGVSNAIRVSDRPSRA